MAHRNHRRTSRNRKRNPSGLAIAGSLLAIGVGGVVLRDILKKDSPPSKLPPGGGPIVEPPVKPPVEPPVGPTAIPKVYLSIAQAGADSAMQGDPVFLDVSGAEVDGLGEQIVEIHPTSLPFDLVVSLVDPRLTRFAGVQDSPNAELIAGNPDLGRDLIFRVTAVDQDQSSAVILWPENALGADIMYVRIV